MSQQATGFPPKIIWMLWLQGWDDAPRVVKASRRSWQNQNPKWVVHCLDRRTLTHFLPAEIVERVFATPKEPEALSDQVRLELLHRYGGVWADATTICARPLDDWLSEAMPNGFFAFARPGPDRMLSTWFLAAEKGSYIIDKWRAGSWTYWQGRVARGTYFWVHDEFARLYETDPGFRLIWDGTPEVSAAHRFHFGPSNGALSRVPDDIEEALHLPPAPVFKITHKFAEAPGPNSLFARLCEFAEDMEAEHSTPAKRRLLVGWYGSFPANGTIGDLRSLETVVSHLVGRGHEVFHASADPLSVCGATRVDWQRFPAEMWDAVIFVCGPILRNHPKTKAFFDYFAGRVLAGVGVSILPADHPNHSNPFVTVFARQGADEVFGDLAICAPQPLSSHSERDRDTEIVVGVSLRGKQQEYGEELCRWRDAATMFEGLTDFLVRYCEARIIEIENHLQRSGRQPDEIEDQYCDCDLVLTTRFHGAITALRQNVPFIALDQIDGGAKVSPLLAEHGWDAVFSINAVRAVDLARVGLNLLHEPHLANLAATRSQFVRDGNRTLHYLDNWIDSGL